MQAPSPLLLPWPTGRSEVALTTAIECAPGLSCGVKSARRIEQDAALRLDGPLGAGVMSAATPTSGGCCAAEDDRR